MTQLLPSETEAWVQLDFNRVLQLEHFLYANKPLEDFAAEYGIADIYSDSNIKQLQQALYLGLTLNKSRASFDATDSEGIAWELKSLNVSGTRKEFTTCSRLSAPVLQRYKNCRFAFSIYENTLLKRIYVMDADFLLPYFLKWESILKGKECINNPKIHLSYVQDFGQIVFDREHSYWDDPIRVLNQTQNRLPKQAWFTPTERRRLNATAKKNVLCTH